MPSLIRNVCKIAKKLRRSRGGGGSDGDEDDYAQHQAIL